MKLLKWSVVFLVVIVGASVVTAMAIQRQSRKADAATAGSPERYQVRGEVRSVDLEGKSVRIKHEEIPDYMAAMTMPFDVRDTSLLRGLKAGDVVGFELAVTKEDSWIASIQKLSEAAAATAVDVSQLAAKESQRVQAGEPVPDFALTDQNGRAVRLNDFRGKAVLLTFIYTRCPLPNYCPLMSKNFASLQERLEKAFPGKFQLISVSIDPQFDRPEVLKEFAARYTKNDSTWTYGTGTAEQSDAVGAMFGLVQERAGGLINHDLRTALIAPDGKLVHLWKSNVWTPYEVQRRVEELLTADR
ncbi:MAG TPA: SCO family protein [Candidatus Acidoferrum sp.]|nr:SCO family protein [Candidatus Acidoferrum sp.]